MRSLPNDPVRAGLVQHASDYPWSGSSLYTFQDLAEHADDWNRELVSLSVGLTADSEADRKVCGYDCGCYCAGAK